MTHIATSGNWLFEIKEVRAIKVKKYGNPFEALVQLKIVDGCLHVESAISKNKFTRKDWSEIEFYIKSFGFNEYCFSRYKNGERIMIKRFIK